MTSIRTIQAARLKKAFRDQGKTQLSAFQHLSQTVEDMTVAAKAKFGERSGVLKRGFGEDLVRMKQRFTARQGVPPANIYRTPSAWIRVIEGLATELGQSPDAVLSEALEAAFAPISGATGKDRGTWLDELSVLLASLTENLRAEENLEEIGDYIARSGLMLRGQNVIVGEWPSSDIGFVSGEAYNPDTLGLVPHVLGLNYFPFSDQTWDVPSDEDCVLREFPEIDTISDHTLSAARAARLSEGTRTGMALALNAKTGLAEIALIEWQHADVSLQDGDGVVLASFHTDADVSDLRVIPSHNGLSSDHAAEAFKRPVSWLPNSVRFYFPDSAGFARLAASLIVRPWIWTDPAEHDFWCPDPTDAEDAPVVAPRHSVAAAIEGNLLYAAGTGKIDLRLDRQMTSEIKRVVSAVEGFRSTHEVKRRASRELLLTEWNKADQLPTPRK